MKKRNINKSILGSFILIAASLVWVSYGAKKDKVTPHLKLWYKQPANASKELAKVVIKGNNPQWLKALPLGNGALGAMVYGDVSSERIQLNEETMWTGSPDDYDNPTALEAQAKIRTLLFEGKYKEATALTQQTQICKGAGTGHGKGANVPFGCYQTLGDLWIDFGKESDYDNYYRELDLEEAVVRVHYTQNGVNYQREIFVSHPDQSMIVRLTADKPGSISFKSTLTRPENYTTVAQKDQLIMQGALSDGKGGKGLQYMTRLSAKNKNGTLNYKNSQLIVEKADEVILYFTASTDYVLEYPNYKGRLYKSITATNLLKAQKKNYHQILKSHIEDYQQYYKRVSLELVTALDTIPTDIPLPGDRKYDGYNLLPLLSGEVEESPRNEFAYYNGLTLEAIRRGDWKLHLPRDPGIANSNVYWAVRRNKVVKTPILNNLDEDISEEVVLKNPQKIEELKVLAEKMRVELGDWDRNGSDRPVSTFPSSLNTTDRVAKKKK